MLPQQTTERIASRPQETIDVCIDGRMVVVKAGSHDAFWQAMADGRWESETLRVFDSFIDADTVVFDVGAWIGPTTIYAATRAAAVVAFEPDPVACAELKENIRLNFGSDWAQRVTVVNKAVACAAGTMRLGSREGLGQSVSSALDSDATASVAVDAVSFDSLADDPRLARQKAFVKIDIEGGEYDLLMHPSRLLIMPETVLCLSLHPRILRRHRRGHSGRSPWAMLARRWSFVRTHRRLIRSLPFDHIYSLDARPLQLWRQMIRAFLLGTFEREIVATHRPWKST